MNEHKSDTLEQRKKAQKDFLELKKMQSGEITPDAPKSPEKPKTFTEKVKNYWYHFKIQIILLIFLIIALAICVTQCATRDNYDAEIILYTKNSYSAQQVERLTEYLTQFFTDTNGDGKVLIQISDCSYSTEGTYDSNYTNMLATKLNATIASGVETQLYILDAAYLEQLNDLASDYGGFLIDFTLLPDEVKNITDDDGHTFPEGLIIGRRVLKGTVMENKEAAVNASEDAAVVLERIRTGSRTFTDHTED